MSEINLEALFCDETEEYRNPAEVDIGQMMTFTFRTGKGDVDSVSLVDYSEEDRESFWPMHLTRSDELFDYYTLETIVRVADLKYGFSIRKGEEVCYFDRFGVSTEKKRSPFVRTAGFHVPEWSKGALMYQIYVDRFCNGDKSNDVVTNEYSYIDQPVEQVENWNEPPNVMDVRRFYGGDLKGVLYKLDYLKSLKVEVIYLNPIFVSPSNHKYDCQDYAHVDPHLGVIVRDTDGLVPEGAVENSKAEKYSVRTAGKDNLEASDALFAHLVEEAHARGMKVIVDGVFNHCGSFNRWLDAEGIYQKEGGYPEGAYQKEDSIYHNYFSFSKESRWPDHVQYDGWWGHKTLPKLNYEGSKELEDYIMKIAAKWVSPPYNCDGWRLDVAADLGKTTEYNHRFWKRFRKTVKEANPEAIIIAEHYGDPESWLRGDEWDTIMNYDAFMDPVSWFLTGLEKHSDREDKYLFGNGRVFFESMQYNRSRMQGSSLLCSMNELSNHDHSRFLTRTNRTVGRIGSLGAEAASKDINYGRFRQGVVMLMTWPGAPTIYYGDEAGVCGWTDPDCRRTYPWGNEDFDLIEFHKYMTGIRNRNLAFRTGSVLRLAEGDGYIAYGRLIRGEENKEGYAGVVAVNTQDKEMTLQIPVWKLGFTDGQPLYRKMLTYEKGYNAGPVEYITKEGTIDVVLPPISSVVLSDSQR